MAAIRICFLFLALVAFGESADEDSTIVEDIITETKTVGATGQLNCTVSNKRPSDTVVWSRIGKIAGKDMIISRDESITARNPLVQGEYKYAIHVIRGKGNTNTLKYVLAVRRLTEVDDGMYECTIFKMGVDNDKFPRRQGRLYVQRPPFIDKATTTSMVSAKHGTTAQLVCAASGRPEPKIMWTRLGNHYLKNEDGNYVPRIYGQVYTVKNVDFNDRGLYRCMADNNVRPPAVFDITLNVQYPPTAAAFRTYIGQAADRNYEVELNCRVTGNPDPNMQWFKVTPGKKEAEILDDNKHDVEVINSRGPYLAQGENWMILRIRTLQMGDFGNYTCRASNEFGVAAAFINVFPTRTCQGPNCYNFQQKTGASCLHVSMATIVMIAVLTVLFH